MLFVELQATVQLIIEHLSFHLDPDNPQLIDSLSQIIDPISGILDDVHTGGGSCSGHFLLLIMHLFNRLGEEKLVTLFQQKFDTICRNIKCLEQAKDELKVSFKQGVHLLTLLFWLAELCSLIKEPPICICFDWKR